ncbi:uncharacterized protein LOC131672901 [Phymastichus coffea]|uniref:uncharacterized protein LOC131672901 n=1 Tax=Phymastichus coffea TaxID=108790 RepID=UPI00273C61A7|nr:uncharacterized protein LOC131672901 [Phymastichus coffea]
MSNYCFYYAREVQLETNGLTRIDKFFKGNPRLLGLAEDAKRTFGKYRLQARPLKGGLSGTGDVHHPAKVVVKRSQKINELSKIKRRHHLTNAQQPNGKSNPR